ncbi:MAG: type IV secretion system DNA-binding domain-containing protein [Rhodospirillales bacterium]|nr:type IV secretion system DNA-binding domain-containing protein [Rhodospirillales bacterium]
MTGVGGDTGRGLRVAARGVRTWLRFGWWIGIVVVLAGLAGATWEAFVGTGEHDRHLVRAQLLSETMLVLFFDPDREMTIRRPDGSVHIDSIGRIAAFEPYLWLRARVAGDVRDTALQGGAIGAGLAVAALFGLHLLGRRLGRGRRLRGGELVSHRKLALRTLPWWRRLLLRGRGRGARPYRIADTPWPKDAETRHTIVSGTTGSGKTVLIADLVEQIRKKGERCIVYDKMGSYTETFFDERRDVLLNPLDARAPRWSPFLEARTARDFDTMAAALIPRQKDAADPFWITAARQLFSHGAAVLWQRGETRNRVLVDHLLKAELSALAEAMEGTVAQSIVDPANPKTALSVRAMLTANIGAMDLLPDEGNPFSIREWIEQGDPGFLFLTSRGDQHASLRGLISTWLEIAVNTLLSLPRSDGRRIWVILDELPTLHQLPSLRPGLAESRQFGGCFVLGVQVFSALRDLYGRDGAETISGLCGTRVVLAAPDKDTSEWSAESLGRVEVESLAEGVSYETSRDGVTLSTRRDLRPLVLPAEVARLENLSGYLKFPGAWPVARIGLKYRKRDVVAARFVPRRDGGERGSGPQARAASVDGNGDAPESGPGQSGSSAETSALHEATLSGQSDAAENDDIPACIDVARVDVREEAGGDEAAVLDTAEWTRGTESLPVPANDMHEEPEWLFEGYGLSVDARGHPGDASAEGRGGGADAAPEPSRDHGARDASAGKVPASGDGAPSGTRDGSTGAEEDESGNKKPGKRIWL